MNPSTVTPLTTSSTAFSVLTPGLSLTGQNALITIANGSTMCGTITFGGGSSAIVADPPAIALPALSSPTNPLSLGSANTVIASPGSGVALANVQSIPAAQGQRAFSAQALLSANAPTATWGTSSASAGAFPSSENPNNVVTVAPWGLQVTALNSALNNPGFSTTVQNCLNIRSAKNSFAQIQSKNVLRVGGKGQLNTRILQGGIKTDRAKSAAVNKELLNGALLLSPEQETVLQTPFGSVRVGARSLALVVCNDLGLVVYNLDDGRYGAVSVSVGENRFALAPGRMLGIALNSVAQFEQMNPAQTVGYRDLSSQQLSKGLKAYDAEFNHYSMVAGIAPLRSMYKSSEPSKRKLGRICSKPHQRSPH